MSKNIDFSDTSAARYSLALYELAKENKSLEEMETHASMFIVLITNSKDFASFIKDPTNKKEDLINVINALSNQFKFNTLFTKFINFLISKRRLFYVEKILNNFIETCSKKRGEIKAELFVAKKLTDNEIKKIKDELNNNLSLKIKLECKHDPSLIGGLILKVGSIMFDTSLKNKLQQIQNKMIEV